MKFLTEIDFDKRDIHYYVLLLSAPVLLTIYRYHGYIDKVNFNTGGFLPEDQFKAIFQFIFFFIFLFVLPVLYVKFVWKRDLKDFGLQRGDIKAGLRILSLIPILIVPIIFFASDMGDVRSEYPLAKSLINDSSSILTYEMLYVLFYYIAWEFYFRGFLLFGLKERFGIFNAVLIQTISSCLIHIGKPEGEIIGSIIVGVIFGIIAIKTKSIWYVFLLHASIGVLTDIFVIYR